MVGEQAEGLAASTVVHRIGGGPIENLRLKPKEQSLIPPGISVFLGGTSQEAAAQMRRAFPDPRKYQRLHALAATVGSATVEAIRQAGFEVIPDPTTRFPNHARVVHRQGNAGFSDEALAQLAQAFQDTTGC